MEKKPTDELMQELMKSTNMDDYLKDSENHFINSEISNALNTLLISKDFKKSEVIRNANINEIYGFQIFSGIRKPSRDKLIALCIGMKLSVDETQSLLKIAEFAPLYPKKKRDSIILFGIKNKTTIMKINESLYENAEDTI